MSATADADQEPGRARGPRPDRSPPDGVVTARAAAAILGVNERTVRRAIARGELPAAKRGRAFQIAPAALEGYRLRNRLRLPDSPPPLAFAIAARLPPPSSPGLVAVPRTPPAPVSLLPAPLTRFIGREHEIAALTDLLRRSDVRLVTLIGPGGVGKTRLALQVAEGVPDDFGNGAIFVSLAPLRDPALVVPAIAGALGLRESPDHSLRDRLVAALRGRRLLLVLDNCEHLPGAADDVADLLAACSTVTVLATSRAPWRLSGERLFAIRPLALPGSDETLPLERLARYEAIDLFVERARQVRSVFALDAGNAAAVVEICRRLDGLPLAIELAAVWLRVLTPAALRDRLERRLPLLTGGAADLPARQRTLRDAIAWSYDLLTPDEQRLFRHLAIFAGGFALEAAEWVARRGDRVTGCQGVGEDASPDTLSPRYPDTLEMLAGLIDKSLVQQIEGDGAEPRFAMLETVREFGLEILAERDATEAASAAHAAYFQELAEAAAQSAAGAGGGPWLHRLTMERANLRAALDWLEGTGQPDAVLGLASALWHFWYRHGDLSEGRIRLERALAAASPAVHPAVRARALRGAGVLAWQGADYTRSRQRLEEALAVYDALGDRVGIAWVRNGLGCLFATQANAEQAESDFSAALATFRDLGDAVGIAQLTANLGELAAAQGRHKLAITRLEQALTKWRDVGDRVGATRAQVYLGQALLARGELARAEAALLDALAAIGDVGYEQILPAAMRTVAHLAARRGAAADAARWLGAEDRVRTIQGRALPAAGRAGHEQTIAEVRALLGEAAFRAAWDAGRADPTGLVAAALAVHGEAVSAAIRSNSERHAGISALSPRERDVLRLLAEGKSDRQIGEALFITRRTASKHVSSILTKLGVDTRAGAVAAALRGGLI
jgi:excisionase family DNA binding protein